MEHSLNWKKLVAAMTAILMAAAVLYFQPGQQAYAASETSSGETNFQLTARLGMVITGSGVKGTSGFQKDILYLTQEQVAKLQNDKNPQAYGLGDSWRENQHYSSYDNHGTGTYHYSLADGLDVNTILDTVVKGGIQSVNTYCIWSADTYSSKMEVDTTKHLKYFAPGDRRGTQASDPLIAFYKTTTAADDQAGGIVPTGTADRLPSDEAVFVYGQSIPEDDNNCHYIKKTNALYVESPKTLILTDNLGFMVKRLKDFMEQGIYKASYTFESDGQEVTHNVEGTPLAAMLDEMNLSPYIPDYGNNRLQVVSESGKKAYVSREDLDKCFVAWDFTDHRQTPSSQTGQLAVYMPGKTEETAVVYNLSKLNIVDEKGALVTSVPEKPAGQKPSLAAPTAFKAAKNSYNSIRLTWKQSAQAHDGYILYRYDARKRVYSKLKTLSPGITAYTDQNLDTNSSYRYKISAYCREDGIQYESALSAAAAAKPTLDKPSITKLSKKGKTAVTVRWKKVQGASGYQVYRTEGKSGAYKKAGTVKKGSTLSFIDKKVKGKTACAYKVRPYRMVGGKAKYGSFSTVKRIRL